MTHVWGLVDDRTGHTGQVLGVISCLAVPYQLKRLEYNALAALPTPLLGASLVTLNHAGSASLAAPYPPLVIAAGRRTLPILRYIKRQSPTTRTVYLMKPETRRDIDLIVAPEHDNLPPDDAVITTLAPLHAVTPRVLAAARNVWEMQFIHLPRPHIALVVGGGTRQGEYKASQWRDLIQRAATLAGNGSLLITTSRRTPKAALDLMTPLLQKPHLLHRWDTDKENPYLGMLACADGVIVTGDSLSMCAEACMVGKPVFIYAQENVAPPKHRRLHQALYDRGLAHPLSNGAQLGWKPSGALDDVSRVAAEIRRRFPEVFI